jgi:ATP-binding cassette subfamily B protein
MNNYFEEEEFKESKFDVAVWKKIFAYMKPLKKYLLRGLIAVVSLATIDSLYPLINMYALDEIITTGDLSTLPYFIGAYVFVMVLIAFNVYFFIINAGRIQMELSYILRREAFKKLHQLPFSYFDKTPVGWIMARMTSDSRRLAEILSWGLIDLTWGSLVMIGILIVIFVINWQLALIVLAMVPILIAVSIYFRKKILRKYRDIRKENSKITGAYNEGITGAKTTKALVLEESNFKKFDALTSTMKHHSIRAAILSGMYFPSILFIASIVTGLIFYYGGNLYVTGIISVGVLYAFVSYTGQFFEPVMQLANILARLQQAQASAERIMSLIEEEPEIWDTPEVIEKYGDIINFKKENWEELEGNITFEDVTFKYNNGETVLKDFNLTIKKGETVALVGHTGAGKTTIVNLICRFYEPSKGRILIDDKDYKERSMGWLHSHLGYVLQDPHLFSGSIADNIRYGKHDATDEEVIQAAKLLGAHDFIMDFDEGYQTDVGEGGNRLSVGQKQMISFTRALIANPKILILDEATSSVDTKTEQMIQKAINIVMKNRTSIVIAHRLSTITSADRILLLEHGQIIEEGTHQKLIDLKGTYYTLYTNQFKRIQVEQVTHSS